jgi:hypothetical protein
MVNTRSTQTAPPQGAMNAEVPPRQTPDVATLQATIERMQRDMEELQRINATLRQQTGNGEEHSSHNHVNDNQGGGPEPSNHRSENQGGDPEPSIQAGKRRKTKTGVKKLREVVAALEKKCDLLQESSQNGKGKTSVVDNLLQGIASPFTERIVAMRLPDKFKVPSIPIFTGKEDPTEHLDQYQAHLDLHGTSDEVACRAFPLTLGGNARDWFRKIPPSSVDSFADLGRKFLIQFFAGRKRKKSSGHLLTLVQGKDESLKSYIMRFNQEKLSLDNVTDEMAFAALFQGIHPGGALMMELAKKQPDNLQEFMDKAEEFINQEENLRELRLSRQIPASAQKEGEKKKKKEPEVQTITNPRVHKRYSEYNFTPLNTDVTEVLMEIKKDPGFVRPPKIVGEPLLKNQHKYCAYHEANGHTTEGCITLRLLIEKHIGNGRLVKFLVDQRDHRDHNPEEERHPRQYPRREDQPRQYPPRDNRPQRYPHRDYRAQTLPNPRDRDRREELGIMNEDEKNRDENEAEAMAKQTGTVLGEIRTISGGFAGGGETNSARKAYARQAKSWEVYTLDRPLKTRKKDSLIIGFSDDDYAGVSRPHTDALVVSIQIGNHNVRRILVDNGSSADILYWSAFLHLGISRDKIIPAASPLVGFAGEQVYPVGSIELPVTPGEYPRQKTIMVKFLVVDRPSAYNAILGRAALNELEAITSTAHLKMKFPTKEGVGEVRGDQWTARQCYNTSLKESAGKVQSQRRG